MVATTIRLLKQI